MKKISVQNEINKIQKKSELYSALAQLSFLVLFFTYNAGVQKGLKLARI